jgi:PAS domain-containing protein
MSDTLRVDNIHEEGWTYIRYVVDLAREPFLILDKSLRIISANESFYKTFLVTQEETEQKLVYDLGNGQWNSPQLRILLEDILPKSTFFKDFEVEHEFPLIGKKVMMVNARIVFSKGNESPLIIMAMEDLSKQRLLEAKLQAYSKELEIKVMDRTKELETRIEELETMNKDMVDREIRMIELKKEMEEMKAKMQQQKQPEINGSGPLPFSLNKT